MTGKFFADTNIILYTIGEDLRKSDIARDILKSYPVISTQVVNESINVCLRKLRFNREKSYAFADRIMRHTEVLPVDENTIRKSAALPSVTSFQTGMHSL